MEKLGWVTFSESEHVHFIHAFYQIGGKKKMTNQTFFSHLKLDTFVITSTEPKHTIKLIA